LHELRGLYEKFPELVGDWRVSADTVDRRAVGELGEKLKGKSDNGFPRENDFVSPTPEAKATEQQFEGKAPQPKIPTENKAESANAQLKKTSDAMKKPSLIVEYDDRSAVVLLHRRPSSSGLLYIRYEDGGGKEEVDAGSCKINQLTEA
jgi:ParB family chromosome partitioning protein